MMEALHSDTINSHAPVAKRIRIGMAIAWRYSQQAVGSPQFF